MKKVVLIDGNNLLFRSYYATAYSGNIMKNSKGFPTNALYGFINMINKILHEENPEYVMIAFDKGKTFRHDKYQTYKEGRRQTPPELKMQFPLAKELVSAMGIKYYEVDNYEADDIIGSFVQMAEEDDDFVSTIVSSDKDLLQLISDETVVKLLKPTGFVRMTKGEFINVYGIEPSLMVDLKALMGDASDNIPGVKGIGEKTALKLLQEFGSLNGVYKNIDNIKGSVKEKLKEDKANAYMSYDLATICKNVPLNASFSDIKYQGVDTLKYALLLEELEFYSLIKKMDVKEEMIKDNIAEKLSYKVLDSLDGVTLGDFAFYLEILGTNYHDGKILGMGIYDGVNAYFVPVDVLIQNSEILSSSNSKYTYDLKKSIVSLNKMGVSISNCVFDTMIAGYLLNYNVKDDIAYLMNSLDYKVDFYDLFFKNPNMYDENNMIENVILKTKFIYESRKELEDRIKLDGQDYLFNSIEMPLASVLADMEITGIDIDVSYLKKMGDELTYKLEELKNKIYGYAGYEFNLSSPKQLAEVLFIKLGIPYPKKVKDNNYSTSKEILDKVASFHPIVELIEEYRLLSKMYSSYVVELLEEVKDDGKIHTIFNQTLTRTGRLSSMNPNLQNIPIRNYYGRLIRKAFIPTEGALILSSDYSQIELRMFASIAQVSGLIESFKRGEDIHKKTASDVFKVSLDSVTPDMRRQAKAVNFGILYGISSFGLGEDLNINAVDAKKFIDDYMEAYPEIKDYMDRVIKDAHAKGYVTTIMNRKRTITELNSRVYLVRAGGERIALNTPIQGSSADILKKAMVEIYDEFNKRGLRSKMLIQVHDELVFNCYEDEKDVVIEIVKDIMENTYKLDVPLVVDINCGKDWFEAK